MEKPREAIFCDCFSCDHMLVMEVSEWKSDVRPDTTYKELLIYARLSHFRGFFSRLKIAFQYLFKIGRVGKIDYMEVILSDSRELEKMKRLVDEAYEFNKEKSE